MTLQEQNTQRWNNMHIPADKGPAFAAVATRLTAPAAKARYQAVSTKTGVPWWFIAVVHEREASQNWNTQLGQGDPLNRKSTHVPKGRGPFASWEDGAVDALVNCSPFAAKNTDWSVGGALTMLEKYNGLGYYNKGVPSPYVWAGTDQYTSGKYVADGVYDPNTVDRQLGGAGLLKFMGVFDKGISSGTVAAGTVAAGTAGAAATAPSHLIPWIIGGGFLLALVAFLVFDIYSYKQYKAVTPATGVNDAIVPTKTK